MEEILYINKIITFRGAEYHIDLVTKSSDEIVYVGLINDPYTFTITLVANETMINGLVQTSADMIVNTLSNEPSA